MVERVGDAPTTAVREFAARLRELRESVGTPSFRELSGRSRAISHTTLHEAAQGNRLPSWATTVEFVKACGADPADFRDQWQCADDAVRAASRPSPPAGTGPGEPGPVETGPSETGPSEPETGPGEAESADRVEPDPAPWVRRRSTWALAGTAVVVLAGVVTTLVVSGSGGPTAARTPAVVDPALATAADCPVAQSQPPSAPPATEGDKAVLVGDITLPDCSSIGRGQTAVKTWRFKNIGTVPWVGYSLHRVDLPESRDQCQTITDIAIPDTQPGGFVDISTEVTAPTRPGYCFVRFKFEDAQGRVAFPGSRPVYFQVVVD